MSQKVWMAEKNYVIKRVMCCTYWDIAFMYRVWPVRSKCINSGITNICYILMLLFSHNDFKTNEKFSNIFLIQIRPHIILIDDLSLSFLLYITDTLSTLCNPTTDWLNFYWVRDESRRVKCELLINSRLIDYKDLWPIAPCCTVMFI